MLPRFTSQGKEGTTLMRRLNLVFTVLMVVAFVAMILPGAAFAEEPAQKPVKIYLVAHCACSWDAFWCPVEKASRDAAKDLGVDVTLLTTETFNPEETAQNVDKALAARPDAIGVSVTDGKMFQEPMMRAIKSGIPVIAYNAADWRPKEERIPYATYIGQDEYAGGYQGGKLMLKTFTDGKAGVCVNQGVGHTGLDARCQGFADALKEAGVSSEVLSISNEANESSKIIEDYHTAHPDVNLWMTLGPNGAVPFYGFLDRAGLKPAEIHHGTFDLSPQIMKKIDEGVTLFGIDQQPYEQGYLVVQYLTWMVRYGLKPAGDVIPTGPNLITKADVPLLTELTGTYR